MAERSFANICNICVTLEAVWDFCALSFLKLIFSLTATSKSHRSKHHLPLTTLLPLWAASIKDINIPLTHGTLIPRPGPLPQHSQWLFPQSSHQDFCLQPTATQNQAPRTFIPATGTGPKSSQFMTRTTTKFSCPPVSPWDSNAPIPRKHSHLISRNKRLVSLCVIFYI